ncbi:Uncharacterised protein [Chlamydia trachomatis]|nr:Uncharacterised protein [Chlamydia trachomatis]
MIVSKSLSLLGENEPNLVASPSRFTFTLLVLLTAETRVVLALISEEYSLLGSTRIGSLFQSPTKPRYGTEMFG